MQHASPLLQPWDIDVFGLGVNQEGASLWEPQGAQQPPLLTPQLCAHEHKLVDGAFVGLNFLE